MVTHFTPNYGPSQGPSRRPYFASTPKRPVRTTTTTVTTTRATRSTTAVPTLPPPGGDIPPYMKQSFNQNKDKFKFTFDNEAIWPSMVKKVPVQVPKVIDGPTPTLLSQQTSNPFSDFMSPLKSILMPKWFQEPGSKDKNRPRMDQVPVKSKRKHGNRPSTLDAPMLPPPSNFPSFEKAAKMKKNGGKFAKKTRPTAGPVMVPVDNYADFFQQQIRDQFMSTQRKGNSRPPLQFSPAKSPDRRVRSF